MCAPVAPSRKAPSRNAPSRNATSRPSPLVDPEMRMTRRAVSTGTCARVGTAINVPRQTITGEAWSSNGYLVPPYVIPDPDFGGDRRVRNAQFRWSDGTRTPPLCSRRKEHCSCGWNNGAARAERATAPLLRAVVSHAVCANSQRAFYSGEGIDNYSLSAGCSRANVRRCSIHERHSDDVPYITCA